MIQMINGTYGYNDNGRLIPKTSKDGPFSLSAEKEKRLVDMGVAKYTDTPHAGGDDENTLDCSPDYSLDMKLDDLKALARDKYGIDASACRAKREVIELIEASSDREEGGVQPPDLSPAPPVDGE